MPAGKETRTEPIERDRIGFFKPVLGNVEVGRNEYGVFYRTYLSDRITEMLNECDKHGIALKGWYCIYAQWNDQPSAYVVFNDRREVEIEEHDFSVTELLVMHVKDEIYNSLDLRTIAETGVVPRCRSTSSNAM